MDLCLRSCCSVRGSVRHTGQTFHVGYSSQIFQPNSFIPAMLVCTIDFYLSITLCDLDLGCWSHDQNKVKPVDFFLSHTFRLNGIKFTVLVKQFRLNIPRFFLVSLLESKEITTVLLTRSKHSNVGMHSWAFMNRFVANLIY